MIDNKAYYSFFIKGGKKRRIEEEDSIYSKKRPNDNFLNQKRKLSSSNIKTNKKKNLKEVKEIVLTKKDIAVFNSNNSNVKPSNRIKNEKRSLSNYLKKNLYEKVYANEEKSDSNKIDKSYEDNKISLKSQEQGELGLDEPLEIVNVGRIIVFKGKKLLPE